MAALDEADHLFLESLASDQDTDKLKLGVLRIMDKSGWLDVSQFLTSQPLAISKSLKKIPFWSCIADVKSCLGSEDGRLELISEIGWAFTFRETKFDPLFVIRLFDVVMEPDDTDDTSTGVPVNLLGAAGKIWFERMSQYLTECKSDPQNCSDLLKFTQLNAFAIAVAIKHFDSFDDLIRAFPTDASLSIEESKVNAILTRLKDHSVKRIRREVLLYISKNNVARDPESPWFPLRRFLRFLAQPSAWIADKSVMDFHDIWYSLFSGSNRRLEVKIQQFMDHIQNHGIDVIAGVIASEKGSDMIRNYLEGIDGQSLACVRDLTHCFQQKQIGFLNKYGWKKTFTYSNSKSISMVKAAIDFIVSNAGEVLLPVDPGLLQVVVLIAWPTTIEDPFAKCRPNNANGDCEALKSIVQRNYVYQAITLVKFTGDPEAIEILLGLKARAIRSSKKRKEFLSKLKSPVEVHQSFIRYYASRIRLVAEAAKQQVSVLSFIDFSFWASADCLTEIKGAETQKCALNLDENWHSNRKQYISELESTDHLFGIIMRLLENADARSRIDFFKNQKAVDYLTGENETEMIAFVLANAPHKATYAELVRECRARDTCMEKALKFAEESVKEILSGCVTVDAACEILKQEDILHNFFRTAVAIKNLSFSEFTAVVEDMQDVPDEDLFNEWKDVESIQWINEQIDIAELMK